MHNPFVSRLLVAIQFSMIGLLLWQAPWFADSWIGRLVQTAGVLVGLWAVAAMRRFNIVPDPRPDCRLVCHGPYRWVRHPMYLALLLVFTPPVVEHPEPIALAAWAVLVIDLIVKLLYEERLLRRRLDGYADYCRRSHRLIPFLW